jgi:hypothetical protein
MGQGQSSPVSWCFVSCFFQSALAAKVVCSVQKVQNQWPATGNVVVRFIVEDATDFESKSVGKGDPSDSVSAGLKASDMGEGIGMRVVLASLRPER